MKKRIPGAIPCVNFHDVQLSVLFSQKFMIPKNIAIENGDL